MEEGKDNFDYHWWEEEFKEKFGTGLNSMEDRLLLNTQSRPKVGDFIRYVVSKTVDMVRKETIKQQNDQPKNQ